MIFAVPMWGSEVTKSKTEIHLTNTPSEVTWACDVTNIEREGDFTLLFIWPIFVSSFESILLFLCSS